MGVRLGTQQNQMKRRLPQDRAVQLKAYAKVNLTLEVLAKRQDGFHQIATVLQTIDLADELTFEPAADLTVRCDDPGIAEEEDLVLRAGRRLQEATKTQLGALVTVKKHIPVAAGLGGGSSDAAAALQGLDRLWGLGLSRSTLSSIAVDLGSDVPFFLHGGTALAEGRGEVITLLPRLPSAWVVLTTPPMRIPAKTATLYGRLTPSMFSDGSVTDRLVTALGSGEALSQGHLFNVFDKVAKDAFPGLADFEARFEEAGAAPHLCGSGPTLFALVNGPEEGATLQQRCVALGLDTRLVKTVATPV